MTDDQAADQARDDQARDDPSLTDWDVAEAILSRIGSHMAHARKGTVSGTVYDPHLAAGIIGAARSWMGELDAILVTLTPPGTARETGKAASLPGR